MPQLMLAACLLAASLLAPAFGQNTPAPCSGNTDTTKTKIKKGLGDALKRTPLGRTITGGTPSATPAPCPAPSTEAPAASAAQPPPAQAPPQNGATPAALPDDQQPKPGTVRTVKYQGKDIAIATGKDGNTNTPVTYVIIPGTVRPAVKITADPNVYLSVDTPPTVYTVKDGVLTIAEPRKPEQPPDRVAASLDMSAFGGTPSGIASGQGISVSWVRDKTRGGIPVIRVYGDKHDGSNRFVGAYLGHDAQGDYVHLPTEGNFLISNGTATRVKQLPPGINEDGYVSAH